MAWWHRAVSVNYPPRMPEDLEDVIDLDYKTEGKEKITETRTGRATWLITTK